MKCSTCSAVVEFGFHCCFDELIARLEQGGAVTADELTALRHRSLEQSREIYDLRDELGRTRALVEVIDRAVAQNNALAKKLRKIAEV